MREFIESQSDNPDLEEVNFLICFIMSHGKKGGKIVGSDGQFFISSMLKIFQ